MSEDRPFENCECSRLINESLLVVPGHRKAEFGYVFFDPDGRGGRFSPGTTTDHTNPFAELRYAEGVVQVGAHAHPLRNLVCEEGKCDYRFECGPALFDRATMADTLAGLAKRGVYLGTSSWKYQGWMGQVYTPSRYEYRGKVAEKRFERDCLIEYGQTFKTVGVDASYYTYPTAERLMATAAQVPEDFQFGFKATQFITIKRFPNLAKYGALAGEENRDFLNHAAFQEKFLNPCEAIRAKVGVIMLEFSRFSPKDFAHGREFVEALDHFLGSLPRGWPIAVEIRNPNFLHPDYFAMLRQRKAAHVFSSWAGMPSLGEQMAMPGSFTCDDLVAARLLLRPGRQYQESVDAFTPYDKIQEIYPEGLAAGRELVRRVTAPAFRGKAFVYVNNRFQGNAPSTIGMILDGVKD